MELPRGHVLRQELTELAGHDFVSDDPHDDPHVVGAVVGRVALPPLVGARELVDEFPAPSVVISTCPRTSTYE